MPYILVYFNTLLLITYLSAIKTLIKLTLRNLTQFTSVCFAPLWGHDYGIELIVVLSATNATKMTNLGNEQANHECQPH